ncbi:MAG: membrane protein FxsA, partial [Mesorhizobium sp.]
TIDVDDSDYSRGDDYKRGPDHNSPWRRLKDE